MKSALFGGDPAGALQVGVRAFRGPFAAISTPQFTRIFCFNNAFRALLPKYLTPFQFFFHDFRSCVPSIADGRGSYTDFGLFRFSAAVRQHPSGASRAPARASFILRHPSHSLEIS